MLLLRRSNCRHLVSARMNCSLPNRQDSVRKLHKKEYVKLVDDFKSYGQFVNFCITKEIQTRSKERQLILQTFYTRNGRTG